MLGNGDTLWTEYELLEAGEETVLLKPLRSCGREHANDPARYKKMTYTFLRGSGTKIWDPAFGETGWLKYKYKTRLR